VIVEESTAGGSGPRESDTWRLVVGCYTEGIDAPADVREPGHGVTVVDFSGADGSFTRVGSAYAPEASSSVLHPSGEVLYVVREDEHEGAIAAFRLASRSDGVSGEALLTRLGEWPTGGGWPCFISVDSTGRYLLAANYGTGNVAVQRIEKDGSLSEPVHVEQHTGSGPEADRQAGPHAHMILSDPSGAAVLAIDLGTDSVYAYDLDEASGRLTLRAQNHMEAGSGPRHLVFHPSGRLLYLANELGSTVSVCTYDAPTGRIEQVQQVPAVPVTNDADSTDHTANTGDTGATASDGGEDPNFPAGIVLSPDGGRVYWSNRGDESIVGYRIGPDGALAEPLGRWSCGGSWPRHLTFTPDGRVLLCANQRSGNVAAFRVNPQDGSLSPLGPGLAAPGVAHVLAV
jgi:6-phosphogluconolactonase